MLIFNHFDKEKKYIFQIRNTPVKQTALINNRAVSIIGLSGTWTVNLIGLEHSTHYL